MQGTPPTLLSATHSTLQSTISVPGTTFTCAMPTNPTGGELLAQDPPEWRDVRQVCTPGPEAGVRMDPVEAGQVPGHQEPKGGGRRGKRAAYATSKVLPPSPHPFCPCDVLYSSCVVIALQGLSGPQTRP